MANLQPWPGPCNVSSPYLPDTINTITVEASCSVSTVTTGSGGEVVLTTSSVGSGTQTYTRGNLIEQLQFELSQYGCCSPCSYTFGVEDNEQNQVGTGTYIYTQPPYGISVTDYFPYYIFGLSISFQNTTENGCQFKIGAYQTIEVVFSFNNSGHALATDWLPINTLAGSHSVSFSLDGNPNLNPYENLVESLSFTFTLA